MREILTTDCERPAGVVVGVAVRHRPIFEPMLFDVSSAPTWSRAGRS
jgi:hypothetical protein